VDQTDQQEGQVDQQVSEICFLFVRLFLNYVLTLNHAGGPGDGGTFPGYSWAQEFFGYIVDVIHVSMSFVPFNYLLKLYLLKLPSS
jgi:hypothetical protein